LSIDPRRVLVAAALAFASAACTESQPINARHDAGELTTGEAGNGGGEAGSSAGEAGAGPTGAAGNSTGAAGANPTGGHAGSSSVGAAGATGTAGAPGAAGAKGGAGTTGAAGASGAAGGSGAAGATGAAGAGAAGASGAGTIDPGIGCGQIKVYTYTGGIENLLIQNCGGCHYAAPGVNVQGGFSFSYANVTGVTNGHPSCVGLDASKRRVVPGKPDNSLLWIKAYDDSPPSGCGGHMPFQGSRLTMANLCYIRAWIAAGAPQ